MLELRFCMLTPKATAYLANRHFHFLSVYSFRLTLHAGCARGTFPNRRGEVVLSHLT